MAFEGKRNPRKGGRDNFKPKKEFKEELLAIDRVTRVTAGGRQLRFRAVMVIWDGKGRVWLGTWKSWEVVDNGTVPYEITAKFKAAKIMVHPASKGTGIIAGGSARKVLAVAGYSDILAKRYGSSNLLNNAKATMKALTSFK